MNGYSEKTICNINPEQIEMRRSIGNLGMALAVIWTICIFIADLKGPLVFIILFLLWVTGFSGFLQARYKFCSALGLVGFEHLGKSSRAVTDRTRREYFNYSLWIFFKAGLYAVIVSGLTVFLIGIVK